MMISRPHSRFVPMTNPMRASSSCHLTACRRVVPPIKLLDGGEELEPEPEGVPNPEDDDEAEDDDEDEGWAPSLDGNPNPREAAAEANAELGGVNPPGTFIPAGGWRPALWARGADQRCPRSSLKVASRSVSRRSGNPGYGWFAKSPLAGGGTRVVAGSAPSAGGWIDSDTAAGGGRALSRSGSRPPLRAWLAPRPVP